MPVSYELPKHVVVTGAASGIGQAIAKGVITGGACCLAIDQDEAGLAVLRAEQPSAQLLTAACDVTDVADIDAAMSQAERVFGPIAGLAHAAGVLVTGSLLDPQLDVQRFQRSLRINVEGTWIVARAAAQRMSRRGQGSLVIVASNAATTPRVGMGAYCASKAAALMLARCLALELGACGVRSNVVSPGSTDTPMLRSMLGSQAPEHLVTGDLSAHRVGIPLGRVGDPDDVATAVLFLLSEAARHITGCNLRVDGGATWC